MSDLAVTPQVRRPLPNGPISDAVDITASGDAATGEGFCVAFYGAPGVGKTYLAGQALDSEYGTPVLIIDMEGGIKTLGQHPQLDVAKVTDQDKHGFARVLGLRDRALRGTLGKKYGTIIIDNMSELQSMCINHVLRTESRQIPQDARPDIKDWSSVTANMLSYTRSMRDFARNSGTNVFFIAWDRPIENEATAVTKMVPAFSPSFANQFPGILDAVGYLRVRRGGVREITFDASAQHAGKIRRSTADRAARLPLVIQYTLQQKPIADMLAVLKGGKNWPVEKYPRIARAAADDDTDDE